MEHSHVWTATGCTDPLARLPGGTPAALWLCGTAPEEAGEGETLASSADSAPRGLDLRCG
eukprot:4160425-Alexandrium_andersonii.AAC.1